MPRHLFSLPLALCLVPMGVSSAWAEIGGGWESWVESLTPEQLCAAYLNDIISDEDLPGGRASDPCPPGATVDDYPW